MRNASNLPVETFVELEYLKTYLVPPAIGIEPGPHQIIILHRAVNEFEAMQSLAPPI